MESEYVATMLGLLMIVSVTTSIMIGKLRREVRELRELLMGQQSMKSDSVELK